jgi:hypothetical protein
MHYSNRTVLRYPRLFLIFSVVLALPVTGHLFAQDHGPKKVTRCFTMQRAALLTNNVLTRKSSQFKDPLPSGVPASGSHYRLMAVVTVPVVVHIVLPPIPIRLRMLMCRHRSTA